MSEVDSLVGKFTDEARRTLGPHPVVTVVADAPWLQRLAALDHRLDSVEPAKHVIELHLTGDSADARDWYGRVDMELPGERHVLIRRHAAFAPMNAVVSRLTLAAAKNHQDIEESLTDARERWRVWRCRESRLRTASGAALPERKIPWSSLCLPLAVLQDIRGAVEGFAAGRSLYEKMGLAYRRGLLFHGPPGNGKSMLCAAIVTALQWPTIYVTGHDKNDAGQELAKAFTQAADLAPSILCLEDIDVLLQSSVGLAAFLNRLDGCQTEEGLLVLATTNHPENLAESLTSRPSRFDRIFRIEDPGRAQREDYLGRLFGERLSPADRMEVAELTDGMSMAFLKEILVSASTAAFSRGDLPTRRDVDEALGKLRQHRKQVVSGFTARRSTGFLSTAA